MAEWLIENWLYVTVPNIVFLAFLIVALWARKIVYSFFERRLTKTKWEGSPLVLQTTRAPFFHWCLILGAFVAIQVSILPSPSKLLAGKILGSLFIISLIWVVISLAEKLLRLYLTRVKVTQPQTNLAINVVRVAIIVVGILILLDIWGAPTTPVVLLLATAILVAVLASRDALLNIFSGFELARGDLIKTGDYIKLESGEEGYVVDIAWRNTRIKTLDDSIILVPNSKLVQTTVVNYGHPLKKATQPFHFFTRLHQKELTGLKASSLSELVDILRDAPDSVVYYHTHHFLEEYQYLTPEPANDFALWVGDALGDEVLAEKLASIDTFDFPTIGALRARILAVIDEYLAENPNGRNVLEGREFHFIKSVSVILPTHYIAHDLREFIEILRKVTIDSLYFHIFEARLRLRKGVNDFSIWLDDCLEEKDVADKIAALDPYNYTLEGLRTAIIQLIEKRIK